MEQIIYAHILTYVLTFFERVEQNTKQNLKLHRLRVQIFFEKKVIFFELKTPADDGKHLGYFDSQAEMSVGVRKCGLWLKCRI